MSEHTLTTTELETLGALAREEAQRWTLKAGAHANTLAGERMLGNARRYYGIAAKVWGLKQAKLDGRSIKAEG